MEKLRYSVDNYDEENINLKDILKLIKEHKRIIVPQLKRNLEYYKANHEILNRTKVNKSAPNNRTVCNHAKDIADTSTGYFMSSALTFNCNDDSLDLDRLTDIFDKADVDEVDHDNALDMSRCGCAFEYVYAKEGTTVLTCKNLDVLHTFIVYDDTIEENELFAVYYNYYKDDASKKYKYIADVLTANYHYKVLMNADSTDASILEQEQIYTKEVPVIFYQNNKDCIGDYEQQISLIDAYNTLMSDRVNDKEQFLDSLLIIYGSRLADDVVDQQGVSEISKALRVLKENGFLELPDDARAEYIARTFDEQGVEVLRKALKEDIYNFSHVPNMSDENFASNASGVAMEYKLLALENITATKERYYTKGLKKRIRLFCNYMNMLDIAANPSAIMPVFSRGLPKNILELSQIIANLRGFVSRKTLIQQLPFVEDAEGELEKVDEENKEQIRSQQNMFSTFTNTTVEKGKEIEDKNKRRSRSSNNRENKQSIDQDNIYSVDE